MQHFIPSLLQLNIYLNAAFSHYIFVFWVFLSLRSFIYLFMKEIQQGCIQLLKSDSKDI